MIEAQATVYQGLDQQQVQIEIELGAICVGNMTIKQNIVLHPMRKEK